MSPKVLIAASGSVSTVKVPKIALEVLKFAEVRVVLTKSAEHFVNLCESYDAPTWREFQAVLNKDVIMYKDEDEWWSYQQVGRDSVVHIELRKWADIMLVSPLTANTLAKLANGICDNLLTSVARAWDFDKPIVVAPAMNTHMWSHPFTSIQLESLRKLGYEVIDPISKELACGDIGVGALASVGTIVDGVKNMLEFNGSPKERVVTWELKVVDGNDHEFRRNAAEKVKEIDLNLLLETKQSYVVAAMDTATNVVFSYAVVGGDHTLKRTINLSQINLRQFFQDTDFAELHI